MTLVRLGLTVPGPDGDETPAVGRIQFRPSRAVDVEHEDGTDEVLPVAFTVTLPASDPVELRATGATWCWQALPLVRGYAARWAWRSLAVPDVAPPTVVDYADLADVDPTTLDPQPDPAAVWQAALDAALAAIADTV